MTSTLQGRSVDVSGVGRLVLPSGHVALFDAADQALVERYHWQVVAGTQTFYAYGYLWGHAGRRTRVMVPMHRLLLEAPQGLDVDHRNNDGLDNRRVNLRLCTRSQNNANARQRPGVSGYRGVTWNQASKRWQARVWINGRCRHLGLFVDPWEAAQAYNAAAVETWGDFARLNERVRA